MIPEKQDSPPPATKCAPEDVDNITTMDKSFLQIDQHALDTEWLNQPTLYFDYSSKLADARKDHDESKSKLDITYAEMDAAIRSDPEEYGLEKITEGAIKSAIQQHEDYQVAEEDLRDCKHTVDVLSAAVSALDQRKRALESLVSLHGQNYFSEPRTSKAGHDAIEEVTKKSARSGARRKSRGVKSRS